MKLSEELSNWRADRPDEWKMDEFIRNAEKLESESNALSQKLRAAQHEAEVLAATVEALRKCGDKVAQELRHAHYGVDCETLEVWGDIAKISPQQHLRDVRAEAGRAGFIAGYHKMHIDFVGSLAPEESAGFAADQYAERIRSGSQS